MKKYWSVGEHINRDDVHDKMFITICDGDLNTVKILLTQYFKQMAGDFISLNFKH